MSGLTISLADIAAIREAAETATPGPWSVGTNSRNNYSVHTQHQKPYPYGPVSGGYLIAYVPKQGQWSNREADINYIAACSPDRILAILDLAESQLKGEANG